jgi:pyruvate dehydrogenase E2 component (dihydrolipoamide acetyltransferase)
VKAGDVVAQVETEKATLDVEAFEPGVLIGIAVKAGETAPVGAPIAWLGAQGEKVPPPASAAAAPDAAREARAGGEVAHVSTQPAPPAEAKAPGAAPLPPSSPDDRPPLSPRQGGEGRGEGGRPPADNPPSLSTRQGGEGRGEGGRPAVAARRRDEGTPSYGARAAPAQAAARSATSPRIIASPAARKRAREQGIDLGGVDGSGPRGRIVLADLERAPAEREARPAPAVRPERPAAPPEARAPAAPAGRRKRALPPKVELREETIPLSPMRRAIARNLAASKPGAPHFYLETSVDARRLVALREQLEELEEGPVSLNDLIVKATAEALSRHPEVNAAWGADAIVRRGSVDIGIAVALEDGLVTPVVREADRKHVLDLAAEIRELAGRAREKRLKPEEYQGASFTISNLGMFGIEAFYAVINPPEGAILAVGAAMKVPWVDDATGQLVAMERMRLGLSCDHRVIDGATGARFLQTLRAVLESPVRLVVS